jgi:roadblock/LC7 domain-containing protein
MIKRLLALDGVAAVVLFRDDGAFLEGYGMMEGPMMEKLASFAHDYKRMTQSNVDQLSMFTQLRGWTPPKGWIVVGKDMSVCSVGNLVCLIDRAEGNLTEVMKEMQDVSNYL